MSPWMMKEISKSLQTTELFRPGKYETYNYDIGMVLQLDTEKETNFPIKISAYIIERNGKLLKTNIDLEENLSKLSVLPEKNFEVLMNFSYLNYKHLLQANYTNYGYSYYSSFYSANIKELYLRYFFSQLEANWSFLTSIPNLKLLQDKTFSKSNLEDIQLDTTVLDVDISIEKNEKFILIKSAFKNSNGDIVIDSDEAKEVLFGRILKIGQRLYLINESPLTSFLATMPVGMLTFPIHFEKRVLTGILLPLSKKFGVVLPENMAETIKVYPMSPSIHVKEFQNSSLIIEPIFYYDQYKFDLLDEKDYFEDPAHPDELIVRDRTDEQNFVEYIRSFHAHFRQQNFQPYFTLPFDLVMKNNWFISFTRDLLAKGVKIVGFNELKKFKYNSNKPDWDMKISSGIDWFDVKIKVSYGDQQVSLKDIRKAIINQQDFIVLDDGSIGILPEEWLNKYAKLFKFSVEEKDGIKISKKQFNIIEMLFNQIDDIEIVNEINEKKQKLLEVSEIKTAPIPSSIQAELRPYQENGYKWMQVLDEISWGGCLADDMGLGKTLQTITFLAYIKEKHKSPTSLIICPTSLIYNWENEINKFAPDLTYYIYYGADRSVDTAHLMTFDVVITSYGIIRNDIEKLSKCTWEYAILDESQAIKNPDALSTKAVQLLQARNRFILSGT
ncbi:MAG: hypothetical protein LC107_11085, partial [Chitinophagales bacterium]|nr:hypothetical protein [Chitinophagales bacterium]